MNKDDLKSTKERGLLGDITKSVNSDLNLAKRKSSMRKTWKDKSNASVSFQESVVLNPKYLDKTQNDIEFDHQKKNAENVNPNLAVLSKIKGLKDMKFLGLNLTTNEETILKENQNILADTFTKKLSLSPKTQVIKTQEKEQIYEKPIEQLTLQDQRSHIKAQFNNCLQEELPRKSQEMPVDTSVAYSLD